MFVNRLLSKFRKKGGIILTYQRVTKYCEDNNLSISAFEKKCGIGNGVIRKWNEGSKPSLDTLQKIEKVTGISVSELIKA